METLPVFRVFKMPHMISVTVYTYQLFRKMISNLWLPKSQIMVDAEHKSIVQNKKNRKLVFIQITRKQHNT